MLSTTDLSLNATARRDATGTGLDKSAARDIFILPKVCQVPSYTNSRIGNQNKKKQEEQPLPGTLHIGDQGHASHWCSSIISTDSPENVLLRGEAGFRAKCSITGEPSANALSGAQLA